MYASAPSIQANGDLSCPVLVNEGTQRIDRRFLDWGGGMSSAQNAIRLKRSPASRASGINVFPAERRSTTASASGTSGTTAKDEADGHLIQTSGWTAAPVSRKSREATTHHVYLVPSASEPLREGFVRVINHSAEAGEVSIDPVDDGGRQFDTITLAIDANETVHFNSGDLETGNEGKGLTGSTGSGEGDWRLALTSELDVEVLAYIRTTDGFLTAMHDVVPREGGIGLVATFNPGSNRNQVSRLRLINPTDATADVTVRGTDDKGMPGIGEVSVSLDAGTAREITAKQLEEGATGLAGMLGDGSGKWQVEVESEKAVVAMSLLESPTDHLTNLSTVPVVSEDGVHGVPLFPAAGDVSGRQGFVRVINNSDTDGEVSIKAYDETERDYETLTLRIGANEVIHFNSDDLEQGSPSKGLSGGTGAGEGDWRLELTSDLEIEVLSYIRTEDGFLTAMHDVAPSAGNRHRVAVFNPGSNRNQESLLRLINPGDAIAEVTITGIDGNGGSGASAVTLSVAAGGSRTVGAWDLESGAEDLNGALGDGAGKWQLMIESDRPVVAMSLLRSPTGHLTNLSTAPVRGARGGVAQESQTAEAVFRQLISGPIVLSKCIACHVDGGASGNTQLVFVPDSDPDHEATNLQVFRDFLDDEEDGASYILNKIQGALGHGGGIQVAAGTDEYSNMERFLSLLGEDVGQVTITPDTLFDGVKMESARSTLLRAAIIIAGRMPTDEEYGSIRTGGMTSLRTAIRGLMEGPEFHEFLIRGANDRLFTDRATDDVIDEFHSNFPILANEHYQLSLKASESGEKADHDAAHYWRMGVQHGFRRAPLELIAHVAETDLPYTEILTADYILANPLAAEAYGASTEFENADDVREFRPSRIVEYYRRGDGADIDFVPGIGTHVVDPGPWSTDYPHAGVLNTTAFLLRYPTTATNRNRARSRWTYYHFLGVDIEKSASRTTDPVALADTNNPTLNNSACKVCHSVLDPVAGAFQNYGDEGLYRDQWGGMDSLDEFYKHDPSGRQDHAVTTRTRGEQVIELQNVRLLAAGSQELGIKNVRVFEGDTKLHLGLGEVVVRNMHGDIENRFEVRDVAAEEGCGEPHENGYILWDCGELLVLPLDVSSDGDYTVEIEAWVFEAGEKAATLQVWTPGPFYRNGDTWYRDMRIPGFDGQVAPSAENSLQWLAERIVRDDRFAESTVKFWWPVLMGSEVVEPPEGESDATFAGQLLASNSQAAEVSRLARGFRQGFAGGPAYNIKDLLVEIAVSKWFRAESVSDAESVRMDALRTAGAKRLLTPEELSRKTLAVTGFQWGRLRDGVQPWRPVHEQQSNALTDRERYGLLYGGIDSDGVTERARDITSVMAGVAQSHALESSCPIAMKEFFLGQEEDRRLFYGVDLSISPDFEFGETFEVKADDWDEKETLTLDGRLKAGLNTIRLSYVNEYYKEIDKDQNLREDRNLRLDKLDVTDSEGRVVFSQELENTAATSDCNHPVGDHFGFHCAGAVEVPIEITEPGNYSIEVVAWADQAGDESAVLEIVVASDPHQSEGSRLIRDDIVELYERLNGIRLDLDADDIQSAYELFVDVWRLRKDSGYVRFFDWNERLDCGNWASDHFYLEGIVEAAYVYREDWDWGAGYDWDWDRVHAHFESVDWTDVHGVAETWAVVLAYLMMDYRYLYF